MPGHKNSVFLMASVLQAGLKTHIKLAVSHRKKVTEKVAELPDFAI